MKKITIMALHLGYGGIEKAISSLANGLSKNYKVEIVCVYKLYNKPAFLIDDKVDIKYLLNYGPNKKEIKEAIKSKNILKIVYEISKGFKTLYLRKKLMIKY
ncbi:MAG TPA: glycosyltransferase family 4 protein, partial [Tenericutes bacterium]|nr:glycosyltransferase family 4 protein [Mycoplasmatota bacterium]